MIDLNQNDPLLGALGQAMPRFRSGTARDAAATRAQIEAFKLEVEKRQHRAFKRIILDALTQLVRANPVDTGHSRRNWQVQTMPQAQVIEGVDPLGQLAPATAMQAITRIPLRVKKAYLINPVPYMQRLNEGHSKQAPKGWINTVFQRVLKKYARVK